MMARDEVSGLVRLRTFLEYAQRLATDRTEPGRHSALIALDGVCEYALFLSAYRVDIRPKHNNFESTLNAVCDRLRPLGQRSVLTMHGARNQAQHAAALPDPDQMAGWADDSEMFIRSLVETAFGVSLNDVLLADAVADDQLRAQIAAAELAVQQARVDDAFDSAVAALGEARRRWHDQQSDAYDYMPSDVSFIGDPRWLEPSKRGEDYADISVFTSDLGEYHWLIATRRKTAEGVPLIEADARRALLFAYNWILRWQRFDVDYPRERWREHWQTARPPTAGDGITPTIIGIDVKEPMQLGSTEYNHAIAHVANVPEEGRGTWSADVDGVLAAVLADHGLAPASIRAGRQEPRIGELAFFLDMHLQPEAAAPVLATTVMRLTQSYESRRTDAAERDLRARRVADRFQTIFTEGAPSLFGDVRAQRELSRGGEVVVLLVEFRGSFEELIKVASIFSSRGGVLAATTSRGDTSIVFDEFSPEGKALTKLNDAIAGAVDQVAHLRQFAVRRESDRIDFENRTAEALGLPRGAD